MGWWWNLWAKTPWWVCPSCVVREIYFRIKYWDGI